MVFFIKANFHLEHRGLAPYFNTVINATLEVCRVLNSTENNVMTKWLIGLFEDSLPKNLIHPCPYFGYYQISNVTLNANKSISIFPFGIYRGTTINYDNQDDNIMTIVYELEHLEGRRRKN